MWVSNPRPADERQYGDQAQLQLPILVDLGLDLS